MERRVSMIYVVAFVGVVFVRVWSRGVDGGGDPSGMVRVCLDGNWMSNGYDTLGMLPSW